MVREFKAAPEGCHACPSAPGPAAPAPVSCPDTRACPHRLPYRQPSCRQPSCRQPSCRADHAAPRRTRSACEPGGKTAGMHLPCSGSVFRGRQRNLHRKSPDAVHNGHQCHIMGTDRQGLPGIVTHLPDFRGSGGNRPPPRTHTNPKTIAASRAKEARNASISRRKTALMGHSSVETREAYLLLTSWQQRFAASFRQG
jgi:hypothetical protein